MTETLKRHIIDICKKDKTVGEVYFVAKNFNNPESVILSTTNLDKAIKLASKRNKEYYNVYNSKGKIVYAGVYKPRPVRIKDNDRLSVSAINLYTNPTSTIPHKCYTGILYIDSPAVLKSDKYKIIIKHKNGLDESYYCKVNDLVAYYKK